VLYEQIAEGEMDVVVGTHAIIQEDVEFRRLAWSWWTSSTASAWSSAVPVRQKGYNPDVLVMTATPIPRSLALTLYGDLDISIIDELPPGRKRFAPAGCSPTSASERTPLCARR